MKIYVGKEEIVLDDDHVKFTVSDAGINDYLAKFSGWYSYYNKKLNEAELIKGMVQDNLDAVASQKFSLYKENTKASDKLAEAKSTYDETVVVLKEKLRSAKYNSDQIRSHLRSMDKAHDSLLNICYNLRKEISTFTHNYVRDNDLISEANKVVKTSG